MVINIISMNFLMNKGAYLQVIPTVFSLYPYSHHNPIIPTNNFTFFLQDGWCQLDFCIVLFSWLALIDGMPNLKPFRAFRGVYPTATFHI